MRTAEPGHEARIVISYTWLRGAMIAIDTFSTSLPAKTSNSRLGSTAWASPPTARFPAFNCKKRSTRIARIVTMKATTPSHTSKTLPPVDGYTCATPRQLCIGWCHSLRQLAKACRIRIKRCSNLKCCMMDFRQPCTRALSSYHQTHRYRDCPALHALRKLWRGARHAIKSVESSTVAEFSTIASFPVQAYRHIDHRKRLTSLLECSITPATEKRTRSRF